MTEKQNDLSITGKDEIAVGNKEKAFGQTR